MNQDAVLKLGETFCLFLSRLQPRVPTHPISPDQPRLTVLNLFQFTFEFNFKIIFGKLGQINLSNEFENLISLFLYMIHGNWTIN